MLAKAGIVVIIAISMIYSSASIASKKTSDFVARHSSVVGVQPRIFVGNSLQSAELEPRQPSKVMLIAQSAFAQGGTGKGNPESEMRRETHSEGDKGFLGTPVSAEGFIAIFTVLLFLATFALFVATRDLVKGADRNAAKQLRAYIGIVDVNYNLVVSPFSNPDPVKLEPGAIIRNTVRITVKNYGQTPAGELEVHANWERFPPNYAPKDFSFHDNFSTYNDKEKTIVSKYTVYPTQEAVFYVGIIDPKPFVEVEDGISSILLYGWVKYVDVFGVDQTTNFAYHINGGVLTRFDDYNDAT